METRLLSPAVIAKDLFCIVKYECHSLLEKRQVMQHESTQALAMLNTCRFNTLSDDDLQESAKKRIGKKPERQHQYCRENQCTAPVEK
jgi:hypothetical protein